MQFSFALLLPVIVLAMGASAAECDFQGGSARCADIDSIWKFREDYCTQNWQGNGNDKEYSADNGFSSRFLRAGAFSSQQQCWDSTENIIRECYGNKDGGSWTGSVMTMNINFCA